MTTLTLSRLEEKSTQTLRENDSKRLLRAKYHPSDLTGAICAAAFFAKKNKCTYYVYSGNSYSSFCYRVTYKLGDLNGVNINAGSRIVYSVTEDLTLSSHEVG